MLFARYSTHSNSLCFREASSLDPYLAASSLSSPPRMLSSISYKE